MRVRGERAYTARLTLLDIAVVSNQIVKLRRRSGHRPHPVLHRSQSSGWMQWPVVAQGSCSVHTVGRVRVSQGMSGNPMKFGYTLCQWTILARRKEPRRGKESAIGDSSP